MRTTKASIVGSTDLTNKPDPESTDVGRTTPDDEAFVPSQKAQPKDHMPSIHYGQDTTQYEDEPVVKSLLNNTLLSNNNGYDDEKGNYKIHPGDLIAGRYEIIAKLGSGSFGQVLKCFDHKHKEMVAIKVIRNKKKFFHQAGVEVKTLQTLKENDPEDTHNIVTMKNYFLFRKHVCIVFELLSINLYDFSKTHELNLDLIRRFAIQILQGLNFMRQ